MIGQGGLLLAGRRGNHRDGVGDAAVLAVLGDVIEEGGELVEILLFDRVEFVIVAFGALHGETEPGGAEGANAVGDVLEAVFLIDDTALGIDDVVAGEAGGDQRVESRGAEIGAGRAECGVGQQVAGDLFGDETVVREIGVEGVDHPIAPAPHGAGGVVVEAVGIGVTRGVEPLDGLAFAVVGRSQQAVDGGRVGGLAAFFHVDGEGVEFGGCGWQADEIEAGAAQPRLGGGSGGGREVFALEARENEVIERGARPMGGGERGQRGALWRDEGPVFLVGRALGDPATEQGGLFWGDVLVGTGRRHLLVRVFREETDEEFAVVGFAGGDDETAVALAGGVVAVVEAELGLAAVGVLAVAVKTIFGEDGADVAVEFESRGLASGRGGERGQDEAEQATENGCGHRGGCGPCSHAQGDRRRGGELRGRELAELNGAEPRFVAVIGEHNMAAEFLTEVGVFVEFTFSDAGFDGGAAEFVGEDVAVVEPVLDDLAADDNAGAVPLAGRVERAVRGGRENLIERSGLGLWVERGPLWGVVVDHLILVTGSGGACFGDEIFHAVIAVFLNAPFPT